MNAMIETGRELGRMAFEQQPRESAKAFAAFKAYLDLGSERSLAAVGAKLGKSKRMMEKWSRKFDWSSRVQAQAAHLAEIERRAIESVAVAEAVEWAKTREPLKREAWREAELTIAMVRQAREEWMANGRVPGWEGMARMLELAFKLKQFAAGMPSEVKTVSMEVTGKIDVEWEIALRKVYGGAEVVDVEEVGAPGVRSQGSGDGIPTEKTIGNAKGGV